MEESVVCTPPYQANGNHATESPTVGHVMSEQRCKSTFDFTKIVNNYGLKQRTVCEIVRFFSQFSLKLYIKVWKHFHITVLGSDIEVTVKKKFDQNFWLGCASAPSNCSSV